MVSIEPMAKRSGNGLREEKFFTTEFSTTERTELTERFNLCVPCVLRGETNAAGEANAILFITERMERFILCALSVLRGETNSAGKRVFCSGIIY